MKQAEFGLESKPEFITPARATKLLDRNTSNRKLRDGVVEQYAADMKSGAWTRCVSPIVIYANGDIADGQHRLWAIVESGVGQWLFVVRDFPRPDGMNLDMGLPRTIVDNARISGRDSDLSTQLLSYARAIEQGTIQGSARLSPTQRMEFVNKHRECATWCAHHGPRGKGMRNGLVMAAVGRAWYNEADHDKLARFCEVFSTGFSDGAHESAAIAIRNYMMAKGTAAVTASLWNDTFKKFQNAIKYFMAGKSLTVIKVVAEDTYRLPKAKR